MKKILLIVSFFFTLPAYAHVRWFVEQEPPPIAWPVDAILFLLMAGALVYVGVLAGPMHRFDRFRSVPDWSETIIRYSLALSLVMSSYLGVWLAPNIPENAMLIHVQQVVGILMLANRRVGTGALFVLCIMSAFYVAMQLLVDYVFELLGVALALAAWKSNPRLGLMFLRYGLGLQLITLAVHNKFMNPALGMQFLVQHPFNFMQLVFENFTDLHFVLAAGFAEFCFGLMFLFNRSVRVNALIIGFFFMLTSIVMGIHELIGHLPILAVLIMLAVWGGGTTRKEFGSDLGDWVRSILRRGQSASTHQAHG